MERIVFEISKDQMLLIGQTMYEKKTWNIEMDAWKRGMKNSPNNTYFMYINKNGFDGWDKAYKKDDILKNGEIIHSIIECGNVLAHMNWKYAQDAIKLKGFS